MALIFVDCEANGPCIGLGVLTEFGAVEYKSRETYHGILWTAHSDADKPVLSRLDPNAVQKTDIERYEIYLDFEKWLYQFSDRPIFVSDNPAFDWQWINHGFWMNLGRNPFGHSARRIGDFYAGLTNNWRNSSHWKRLRITKHDHNPVHDSEGNAEAFERMLKGERK